MASLWVVQGAEPEKNLLDHSTLPKFASILIATSAPIRKFDPSEKGGKT